MFPYCGRISTVFLIGDKLAVITQAKSKKENKLLLVSKYSQTAVYWHSKVRRHNRTCILHFFVHLISGDMYSILSYKSLSVLRVYKGALNGTVWYSILVNN